MIDKKLKTSPIIEESLVHGKCVAKSAMNLYWGLKDLHNLPDDWAEVLQNAAQFHDIGWFYGKRAHHKASASMIRAGHVQEIPKSLRYYVAMVARYHRRAEPCLKQWRFEALSPKEREAVSYLSAIIRVADALDFSHTSSVEDVHVHINDEVIKLELSSRHNCQAEINRVQDKKDFFVKMFSRDVYAYTE